MSLAVHGSLTAFDSCSKLRGDGVGYSVITGSLWGSGVFVCYIMPLDINRLAVIFLKIT